MKRFLMMVALAIVAATGMATASQAGAFGLYYSAKYANANAFYVRPYNAFTPIACGEMHACPCAIPYAYDPYPPSHHGGGCQGCKTPFCSSGKCKKKPNCQGGCPNGSCNVNDPGLGGHSQFSFADSVPAPAVAAATPTVPAPVAQNAMQPVSYMNYYSGYGYAYPMAPGYGYGYGYYPGYPVPVYPYIPMMPQGYMGR